MSKKLKIDPIIVHLRRPRNYVFLAARLRRVSKFKDKRQGKDLRAQVRRLQKENSRLRNEKDDIHNLRFVKVKGATYFRAEDVIGYIKEMAACEETDVRNRFSDAADLIREKVFPCARTQDILKNGMHTKPFPICDNPMCEHGHGQSERRRRTFKKE